MCQLGLDERDHRKLALAHEIAGIGRRAAGGLANLQQQVQRHAGAIADLLEGLVAEGGEALEDRRVHEVEGEHSLADPCREVLRADPRPLQGSRDLRSPEVTNAEPIVRIGLQDA